MKARHPKEDVVRRGRPLNLDKIMGGVGVAALLAGLALLGWNHYNRVSVPPDDYAGTIVDRWAGSQKSGQTVFNLVIEATDGKRNTVTVDTDTYELAKVGMRIKSRAGKVILIETAPSPSPGNSLFAPKS